MAVDAHTITFIFSARAREARKGSQSHRAPLWGYPHTSTQAARQTAPSIKTLQTRVLLFTRLKTTLGWAQSTVRGMTRIKLRLNIEVPLCPDHGGQHQLFNESCSAYQDLTSKILRKLQAIGCVAQTAPAPSFSCSYDQGEGDSRPLCSEHDFEVGTAAAGGLWGFAQMPLLRILPPAHPPAQEMAKAYEQGVQTHPGQQGCATYRCVVRVKVSKRQQSPAAPAHCSPSKLCR